MDRASEKENVPSEEECMKLLRECNVPENIIRHSVKVKQFALKIAHGLKKRGVKVDEKLVAAASLLHDLDKAETLQNKTLTHGVEASRKLKKLGMYRVAKIVKKHVLESILKGELKTIEEKIVYYADKRVLGDKIVGLDERFEYLKKRYGLNNRKAMNVITESYGKVVELEKELSIWMKGRSS